jgi:hypothetical protein
MKKFRVYIINVFFSSFIGLVSKVIQTVLMDKTSVNISGLFESMVKGAIIGTISLFVFFHIFIKFRNKPIAGFISNFTIVALLMVMVSLYDSINTPGTFVNHIWVVSLITVEVLSFIVTAIWYRQLTLYNDKLEKKKTSIID